MRDTTHAVDCTVDNEQHAGEVRPCAMCLQSATIFDGDLCNNCDHIYHGILSVIGEYGGTVSDMPLRAVTARMAVDYMHRQADLTI